MASKKQMKLEEGLRKEWILTNGIGGYSYSTILGCNTRKYHGLLVAALTPPARRYLILSKVDEAIEIENKEYPLYTNICKNYLAEGYQNFVGFEQDLFPTFSYQVKDVQIQKMVCMEYGKNTVGIYYKIKNGKHPSKLKIAPIVNFRDFHTMSSNHEFQLNQTITHHHKVKVILDNNGHCPIYMYMADAHYIEHHHDQFQNMYYIEEEKRGFYPEENHVVPGVYEIELQPNEVKETSFICSLEDNIEEINVKKLMNKEKNRIHQLLLQSKLVAETKKTNSIPNTNATKLIEKYIIASDRFIVYRPNFKLHTIIAGYPWFLDWGRDSMIAYEGLLLIPKRYELAKEILLTFIRDMKFGLVPNGYSGYDNRPLYNSVDASLLLFEQVEKYIRYTGDDAFIKKNIYAKLKEIIEAYKSGIDIDDNNIYLNQDHLLSSGTEHTQNTWMDAKCFNIPATPRNGKVVEVNCLWYNALRILEKLANQFENKTVANTYRNMAEATQKSFCEKFFCKKRKCLYDVLGDAQIRPNQLFALSLTYPILDCNSPEAKMVLATVQKKLLNPYGLKTLAKGEANYVEVYEGDSFKRDMSYHQGITWPWLLGLYYDALKNMIKNTKQKEPKKEYEMALKQLIQTTKETFIPSLDQEGILGSIAELYDSRKPQLPKGALAQAWSVAEVFRIILEK